MTVLNSFLVEIRRVDSGALVSTATTNASGISEIAVSAGAYSVRILPATGYSVAGDRAELDSHITVGAGGTAGVTVALSKL